MWLSRCVPIWVTWLAEIGTPYDVGAIWDQVEISIKRVGVQHYQKGDFFYDMGEDIYYPTQAHLLAALFLQLPDLLPIPDRVVDTALLHDDADSLWAFYRFGRVQPTFEQLVPFSRTATLAGYQERLMVATVLDALRQRRIFPADQIGRLLFQILSRNSGLPSISLEIPEYQFMNHVEPPLARPFL